MSRGLLRLQAQQRNKATLEPMTEGERRDPEVARVEANRKAREQRQEAAQKKAAAKQQRKLVRMSKPAAERATVENTPTERHARKAIYHDLTLSGLRHLRDI
ncbi:hypothetical protein KZK78_004604 [Salmonella enterica]|nr:hypothetical protein [Salmonella enterica]